MKTLIAYIISTMILFYSAYAKADLNWNLINSINQMKANQNMESILYNQQEVIEKLKRENESLRKINNELIEDIKERIMKEKKSWWQ